MLGNYTSKCRLNEQHLLIDIGAIKACSEHALKIDFHGDDDVVDKTRCKMYMYAM
jgi:hypothetical protein